MFFKKKQIELPKEIEDFNSFPAEKEKLLCIGASVTQFAQAKRKSQPNFLKLYLPEKEQKNITKYWLPMFGIHTGKSAINLIEEWISHNSYASDVPSTITVKVQKEIEKAAKKTDSDGSTLMKSAEIINNSGAFDLERLGYIIRVCFTLGLLTEEQAWHYLEQLYTLANEHFNSWDEYIISYSNENEAQNTSWYKDIIADYLTIKKTSQNLFDRYPLGK